MKKMMIPLVALAGGGLLIASMRKTAHAAPSSAGPAVPSSPSATNPVQSEQYLAALQLTSHLRTVRRYSEDQNLVRAYQSANGLTADGKYGASTALSIASHGVVPVVPFYWTKATATQQKAAYKAGIAQCEKQYPTLDWSTAITGGGLHPSVDVSGAR
jgi:hypothetical protein